MKEENGAVSSRDDGKRSCSETQWPTRGSAVHAGERDCAKIVPLLLLAGIFVGQLPLPDLHARPSPGLHPPAAGAAGLDRPARAAAGPPCNFSRWSAPASGTLHIIICLAQERNQLTSSGFMARSCDSPPTVLPAHCHG
jgi:hypothetical protein